MCTQQGVEGYYIICVESFEIQSKLNTTSGTPHTVFMLVHPCTMNFLDAGASQESTMSVSQDIKDVNTIKHIKDSK